MATLTSPAGTFWDRSAAQSFAGGAWAGASQVTLNHSLAHSPDIIFANLLSAQVIGCATVPFGAPAVGALRGNASINTVQILGPSMTNGSQPTFSFEVYSAVIHSAVR